MHISHLLAITYESLNTTMSGICVDKHNYIFIIIYLGRTEFLYDIQSSIKYLLKISCNITPKRNPNYLIISLEL